MAARSVTPGRGASGGTAASPIRITCEITVVPSSASNTLASVPAATWAPISATLAIAGALVSAPIIIHLINRMRFKRIRWAAMEFLLTAERFPASRALELGLINEIVPAAALPSATISRSWNGVSLTYIATPTPSSTALTLVATKRVANQWLAHANLGWLRSHTQHQDSSTWNLALEHTVSDGVDLMGEVYGDDRARPWVGAGLRWAVTERFNLNASAATQNSSHANRVSLDRRLLLETIV